REANARSAEEISRGRARHRRRHRRDDPRLEQRGWIGQRREDKARSSILAGHHRSVGEHVTAGAAVSSTRAATAAALSVCPTGDDPAADQPPKTAWPRHRSGGGDDRSEQMDDSTATTTAATASSISRGAADTGAYS